MTSATTPEPGSAASFDIKTTDASVEAMKQRETKIAEKLVNEACAQLSFLIRHGGEAFIYENDNANLRITASRFAFAYNASNCQWSFGTYRVQKSGDGKNLLLLDQSLPITSYGLDLKPVIAAALAIRARTVQVNNAVMEKLTQRNGELTELESIEALVLRK